MTREEQAKLKDELVALASHIEDCGFKTKLKLSGDIKGVIVTQEAYDTKSKQIIEEAKIGVTCLEDFNKWVNSY